MELRFRCAFISFLYRIWNSDSLRLRPKRFYCASTALLPFLQQFMSFWPKFRIVAESPSSGMGGGGNLYLTPPFYWTAIPLRLWRSQNFSKIIPNRRGLVDNHTIWGIDASSTLPLRLNYDSVTLLLRPQNDNEDPATLSLRWWRCSCNLAKT